MLLGGPVPWVIDGPRTLHVGGFNTVVNRARPGEQGTREAAVSQVKRLCPCLCGCGGKDWSGGVGGPQLKWQQSMLPLGKEGPWTPSTSLASGGVPGEVLGLFAVGRICNTAACGH